MLHTEPFISQAAQESSSVLTLSSSLEALQPRWLSSTKHTALFAGSLLREQFTKTQMGEITQGWLDKLDSTTLGSMCHMSASKGYIMEAKESLWQAPHLTAGPAATECLQFCCPAALPHSSHNWHRMQLRGSGGKEFHLLFPGSFHWLLSSLLFFQSTPTPIVNLRTHLRAAISTIPFCTMGPAPLFQLC